MKSKTSCFSTTVFWKDIRKFWPVWICYFLLWQISLPFVNWLNFQNADRYYENGYYRDYYKEIFFSSLSVSDYVVLLFVTVGAIDLIIFFYLFQARSTNMLHAFPVNRTQLYISHSTAALVVAIGPIFFAGIVDILLALSYGITEVQFVLYWFLILSTVTLFIHSLCLVCIMLTGQLWGAVLYYGVANFLFWALRFLLGHVVAFLGWGLNYSDLINLQSKWLMLSPAYYLPRCLSFQIHESTCSITAGRELLIYLGASVVLWILGYVMYKKRNLETAGDLLTIHWLKPIFRWGVGCFAGLFFGYFCSELVVMYSSNNIGKQSLILIFLGAACFFFFIADMFVQKSFRVFHRHRMVEFVAFAGATVVLVFGLYGYSTIQAKRMPQLEDIQSAVVTMDISVGYEGEELSYVKELHRDIAENESLYGRSSDYSDTRRVKIFYELKNHKSFSRTYDIAVSEDTKPLLEKLYEEESKKDNFLLGFIGDGFENGRVMEVTISRGDRSIVIDQPEEIQKIVDAFSQDLEEGTIQEWNISSPLLLFENPNYDYALYPEAEAEYGSEDATEPEEVILEPSYQGYIEFGIKYPNHVNHKMEDTGLVVRNSYYGEDEDADSRQYLDYIYLDYGTGCENLMKVLTPYWEE